MKEEIQFLNLVPYPKYESDGENLEWNKRDDYYREIRKEKNFHTIWSIYEVKNMNLPAFNGECLVYFMGRFNLKFSKQEVEKVSVKNPTWLDLWTIADSLIRKSESEHRTDLYIEEFEHDEDGDLNIIYGS